ETANILHNASKQSLVLMDEIGRGTSTYDGLSLAWAVAEQLAQKTQCLTLFATHYFELTELAEQLPATVNVHVEAQQHNDDIVFLHRVSEGAASQSFGLQVAKLAGVPGNVITAAKQKLQQLEHESRVQPSLPLTQPQQPTEPVVNEQLQKLQQQLEMLELEQVTPKQALDLLYEWKKALD
ncbi:MAG TPA: DNA mismatch repair protein MutS, partial [Idiomarina sp.]|nr:DNA mismatch repair protein MutS [Idiomarina sp.]